MEAKLFPELDITEFTSASEGFAPNTESGYDIRAVELTEKRIQNTLRHANIRLNNGTEYIDFFCFQTSLDIGLSGSTGQSRYVRDFYPHNVNLSTLWAGCQCLNQKHYATIVEFIHDAQRKAVQDSSNLIQLHIKSGGSNIYPKRGKENLPPGIRGERKPMLAQGYVDSIQRTHEQFDYAPIFTFEFIIARMFEGIYTKPLEGSFPAQKSYLEILQNLIEGGKKSTTTSAPKESPLPPLLPTSEKNEAFGTLPTEEEL